MRRQDDFDILVELLDKVFEVDYKDGDIKRAIRLGRKEEGTDRPILVELQSRMLKNYTLEHSALEFNQNGMLKNYTPVWDPGEGKNRPTLLSWSDVVRAD